MVAAETYVLNNEYAPNKEILRISLYHVNAIVNVKETFWHMATQEAEHSLESVVRGHHVYKYIYLDSLSW